MSTNNPTVVVSTRVSLLELATVVKAMLRIHPDLRSKSEVVALCVATIFEGISKKNPKDIFTSTSEALMFLESVSLKLINKQNKIKIQKALAREALQEDFGLAEYADELVSKKALEDALKEVDNVSTKQEEKE